MSLTPDDAGKLLRARGMRSTPQRRAILSVFNGGPTEHLSADEVYARAMRSLPELSRGTVFATLAEFSEIGLLASFGSPEPVRYEINVDLHAHFRCRLCLRLFDLAGRQQSLGAETDPGFVVERVETWAEGICADCISYDAGLAAGAEAIGRSGPSTDALSVTGTAVREFASPLGPLLLAAAPDGLTRLAFAEHADTEKLRERATARRGSPPARRRLEEASASLSRYFDGEISQPECAIDWGHLAPGAPALTATEAIPYGTTRS